MRRAMAIVYTSVVVLVALATVPSPARAAVYEHTFGGAGADRAIAVTSDAQGRIYVLAKDSAVGEEDPCDLVIWRYERIGTTWDRSELWRWGEEEDDESEDNPLGFVVAESAGTVLAYVAAESDDGLKVLRFDEGDEDPVWEQEFDDDTVVDIVIQAIPEAPCPGVVIVGPAAGEGFHLVSYTHTGSVRWEVDEYDPEELDVVPVAATCNDVGEVFVTGIRADDNDDILTVRFAAATGDTVWSAIYDNSDNDDEPVDIAAGQSGYWVVVTGSSDDDNDIDVVTLCYPQDNPANYDDAKYDRTGETEIPVELALGGLDTGSPSVNIACLCEAGTEKYMLTLRYVISGIDLRKRPATYVEVHGSQAGPAGATADGRGIGYVTGDDSSSTADYDIRTLGYTPVGSQASNWLYASGTAHVADVTVYHRAGTQGDSVVAVAGSKDGDALTLLYDVERPTGWDEVAAMPDAPSGKKVKDGGWLTFNPADGLAYAAKGNKRRDFYAYHPDNDAWSGTEQIPALALIPPGLEGKPPSKGCVGCADGSGLIYMTKGNSTAGFFVYDVAANSWTQKKDVPLGLSNKKVKGGTDMVMAEKPGLGLSPYLLKGYKNEFYRYDIGGDSWQTLTPAPVGAKEKWDKGSWLAYDDVNGKIYAHKAKYHELYRYSPDGDSWSDKLTAMPRPGSGGNKKSKDGSCGTWWDGAVYALKGGNTQEFWRYTSSADVWSELDTLPRVGTDGKKKVKAGGDIACADGVFLALKGNKSNQLWRYMPHGEGWDAGAPGPGRPAVTSGGGRDAGETPVLEGVEALGPRWRSDGKACVVSHENSEGWLAIYQVEYSGGLGKETVVAETTCDCEEPAYDASGDRICFSMLDDDGFYQIAMVDLNGGFADGSGSDEASATAPGKRGQSLGAVASDSLRDNPRFPLDIGSIQVLTSGEVDHTQPAFSPTGSHIVYVRDSDDGDDDVYVIPSSGGSEYQVTDCGKSHADPVWLSPTTIAMTHIPDADYDQIAEVTVWTGVESDLTSSLYDHARPDVLSGGSTLCCERYGDDATEIVRFSASGGSETVLTSGVHDMEAPDWATAASIFCTRWTGITSAICRVDAASGGWTAVTDSSAIRDNPDCWYDPIGGTSYILFEREDWDESFLSRDGPGHGKHGTGVFRMSFREPQDGQQSAGLYVLALDKVTPNPASDAITLRWQVPIEADVSLRVYNAAGQLVKVLADGRTKPGAYTSTWNGTDTRGRRLANGVYFCTLDDGEKRISRKVVLTE